MDMSVVSTILRALLRWWWLIVISVALGIGAGYYLRVGLPDIYVARATVLVGQDPRVAATAAVGANNRTLLEAFSIFARRASILEPVIEDLGLNMSVDDLADRIIPEGNVSASLLELAVYDTDPERAAQIANRIAQELVNTTTQNSSAQNQEFVKAQLTDLENQINQLQDRLNQLIAESARYTSAFDINQNRLERDSIQATIQALRSDYANLNSSLGEVQRLVQIFELAVPIYIPIAGSSVLELALAGSAGAILAILTIVLITFFDDRLQWEENEAESIQDVRVLGPLGIIPRNKLPLYVETMPNSIEVQAMRQVRDKIFLGAEPRPRVISFVSYDSGDGKTLTSANMALTFAKSGLRTIVIDLDMRRGDLHEVFRLPNVTGVSDLVAAREPLEDLINDALLDSGYENLTIMTYGRANADPAALLSKSRFPQLIYLLKQRFDMVVMDSAPTIAGSDPVFLAEVSDGVVIVVSARRTTMTGLKRTITSLREAQDAHILGVVFNRVRLQITSKYSNTYYQQVPSMDSNKLSQELLKPGRSPLSLRASVIEGKNGERYYSVRACATRLGVKEKTVREWCSTGYLKAQRRPIRLWIKESDIEALLNQLPIQDTAEVDRPLTVAEEIPVLAPQPRAGDDINHLPNQLREQRAALLDFVNKPNHSDSDQNSNQH